MGGMVFPPLFKSDAKGLRRTWWLEISPQEAIIRTYSGVVDGKIRDPVLTHVTPKSTRNLEEQLHQEANRMWQDKCKKGYAPEGQEFSGFLPMLAKPLKDTGMPNFPVLVQPKLDGIRCIGRYSPQGEFLLHTREQTPIKFLGRIRGEMELLLSVLPFDAVLDGELYRHQYRFNALSSIIRQGTNPHPEEHMIQYHIYDLCIPSIPDMPTETRLAWIMYAANTLALQGRPLEMIVLVPGKWCLSEEDVADEYLAWRDAGYEGAIVRCLGVSDLHRARYMHHRGNGMIKMKEWQDEEGIIVGIDSAKSTEEGCACFFIQDPRGNVIHMRPQGSHEQRREWLANPESCVGRRYTYKFQELSEYGVPRFPIPLRFCDIK
jgi:ATP-dependent DNA ligase